MSKPICLVTGARIGSPEWGRQASCSCDNCSDAFRMSDPARPILASHATLRDHFAGQALAGLTSDPSLLTAAHITGPEGIAVSAYQIADAMIREREK